MPITTLRREGRCSGACGLVVPAGGRAFWDPQARQVLCLECAGAGTRSSSTGSGSGSRELSARTFATSKARQYREQVRSTWGPLAPLVLLLRPDDREVRAAHKGAAGEEFLARWLDKLAARSGGAVAVLHDRSIPGRRENLDHLVVTRHGIWAVDAKAYAGRIATRFGTGLVAGRRDCSRLLEQSRRQQQFVRQALPRLGVPQLPVAGALCFLQADMGIWTNGVLVDGVRVTRPGRLRRLLRQPITGASSGGTVEAGEHLPMTVEQVRWVADRLGTYFGPAGPHRG